MLTAPNLYLGVSTTDECPSSQPAGQLMSSYGNFGVFEDTIFVTGLPEEATEKQLSEYFGQIGVIKFDKKNNCPKIWIYKDKTSGKGKGEATITYDDPPSATSAISWFNGTCWYCLCLVSVQYSAI